jgi:hypothetical protein
LHVPVGKLELAPKWEEGQIRLGSVSIAKTDFVRRFMIGVAPLIMGLLIIFGLLAGVLGGDLAQKWWVYLLVSGMIFEVGNMMFVSRKDLERAWEFLLLALVVGVVLVYFEAYWWMGWDTQSVKKAGEIMRLADIFLLVPIMIDLAIVGLIGLVGF